MPSPCSHKTCEVWHIAGLMHRSGAELLGISQSEPFLQVPIVQRRWLFCHVEPAVSAHLSCPEAAAQESLPPVAVQTVAGQVERRRLAVSGLMQLP